MKKTCLIITLFFASVLGYAQNLVLNPSFEDTVACPVNGFITNSQGWEPFSSSPNYYNSCVPSWSLYSVPNNYFGTQLAASGQAYAGIFSYVEGETDYSIDREILGGYLATPLSIGQKYFVSFKVCLALNTNNTGSSLAINKLGALFSTVAYNNTDSTTAAPINNFAHVYTDSIITDSTNWTRILGSFTADSAYQYISLGNFFKISNTDTLHIINSNPFTPNAYYYVDDICVSTDSSLCANYIYTGVENVIQPFSFHIYPNPTSDVINIKFDDSKIHSISVYNSVGQIVLSKTVIRQETFSIESFPKGIYFIKTSINENITIKKIVIY